jgi:hypothetical protein
MWNEHRERKYIALTHEEIGLSNRGVKTTTRIFIAWIVVGLAPGFVMPAATRERMLGPFY